MTEPATTDPGPRRRIWPRVLFSLVLWCGTVTLAYLTPGLYEDWKLEKRLLEGYNSPQGVALRAKLRRLNAEAEQQGKPAPFDVDETPPTPSLQFGLLSGAVFSAIFLLIKGYSVLPRHDMLLAAARKLTVLQRELDEKQEP